MNLPKYTCKDIDLVINCIRTTVNELHGLEDILENLREANDSLRNTCYSLQNRIEELETELYNYQASGD